MKPGMKMNKEDESGLGPMHLRENSLAELSVNRVTELGAFLDAGTGNTSDDILLHRGQQTRPVKEGERVQVFLYHDPHHRLTASMRLPNGRKGRRRPDRLG